MLKQIRNMKNIFIDPLLVSIAPRCLPRSTWHGSAGQPLLLSFTNAPGPIVCDQILEIGLLELQEYTKGY